MIKVGDLVKLNPNYWHSEHVEYFGVGICVELMSPQHPDSRWIEVGKPLTQLQICWFNGVKTCQWYEQSEIEKIS